MGSGVLSFSSMDLPARVRAKERLYVVLQAVSWGSILGVQYAFIQLFGQRVDHSGKLMFATLQMVCVGLLLTHFSRRLIQRWNWKDLGWVALAPRVVGLSLLLSLVWCSLLTVVQVALLGWKPPEGTSYTAMFLLSFVNGCVTMAVWLSFYFFYHLFDRFNRLEIERLRLSSNVKQAELRALKSQVNPHFIFNSLNSLRALIDENPARARQAVTQLASLLRYSLQSGQQETVTFQEELRVVTDYLALEQVRFEERLKLSFNVAEAALPCSVPPMLLQTLVENAVKYGISDRPQGGEIRIEAALERDSLILRVINPGRLDRSSKAHASTGLGLANAAERLRLLMGEGSSLDLRSDGEGKVVAEAVIPCQVEAVA